MVEERGTLNDALDDYRKELRGFLLEMQEFRSRQPVDIMMLLSAYSARASYMRNRIVRSSSKLADTFRIKELDPFLNEVDRQFKVWSRVVSILEAEYKMSNGGQ